MSELDYTQKPGKGDYDVNQFFDLGTAPFNVADHTIFSCISGSRAYGMNTETSDTDVRGIVVPPGKYFFGLGNFEQVENQSKDVCYFALKKWAYLAYQNNPHALELLYMPDDSVTVSTPFYETLKSRRDMFLSKKMGYTFGGYAWTQLMTMRTKITNHTGRQGLIQQFGYDTKMLAHAVRLYRMGYEALTEGVLNVRRPDAEELKEIRAGKYTYEEAVTFEQDGKNWLLTGGLLKDESDRFKAAFESSTLPKEPNFSHVEQLVMQVHADYRNR